MSDPKGLGIYDESSIKKYVLIEYYFVLFVDFCLLMLKRFD